MPILIVCFSVSEGLSEKGHFSSVSFCFHVAVRCVLQVLHSLGNLSTLPHCSNGFSKISAGH